MSQLRMEECWKPGASSALEGAFFAPSDEEEDDTLTVQLEDACDEVEALEDGEVDAALAAMLSTPEQLAARHTLLSRFLCLDQPHVTPKMAAFLKGRGVAEMLLDFIVRPGTDDSSATYRVRDMGDLQAVKRSYHAMELVVGSRGQDALSSVLAAHLDDSMEDVARQLACSFHPASDANFNHVHHVLSALLSSDGQRTCVGLLDRFRHEPLLAQTFVANIHQPRVLDIAKDILKWVDDTPRFSRGPGSGSVTQKQRLKFCEILQHAGFHTAIAHTVSKDCGGAAAMLFARAFASFARDVTFKYNAVVVDQGCALLLAYSAHWIPLVAHLMGVAVDLHNESSLREAAVQILQALFSHNAAMQSINNESVDTQEVFGPSSFQQLLTVLTTKLTVLADCLAAMLHDAHYAAQRPTVELAGHRVPHAFTGVQLSIVELFVTVLEASFAACSSKKHLTTTLAEIPHRCWKLFVDLFLEFRHNSMYHNLFYRIFMAILACDIDSVQKGIFSKGKLIPRFVEHYHEHSSSSSTSTRGFILLCLVNVQSHALNLPVAHYLPNLLSHQVEWRGFQPILRAAVESMYIRPLVANGLPTSRRPGPLSMDRSTPQIFVAPPTPFAGPMDLLLSSSQKNIPTAAVLHRLFASDAPAAGAIVPSVSGDGKKKRKKKKKKTKNASVASGTDGSECGTSDAEDGSDTEEDPARQHADAVADVSPPVGPSQPAAKLKGKGSKSGAVNSPTSSSAA